MATWRLVWSPTGQTIGEVEAKTAKAARRKAPKPYSKYKGEIAVERQNAGRRVSASKVGTGRWIKASAVRFNRDGTTSVIRTGGRVPNVAGYKDTFGRFHPIRWDSDYDPDELSKSEPGYATDGAQPRGFFVGSKKKRRRPAARKRTAAKRRRPATKAKKRRR